MSHSALAPAAAAGIVLPVALAAIDGLPVGVVHDDAMYVTLAKSLATGHGFRWLNLPGTPAATHFPPGYPALLSLVWRVFPDFPANVIAFKALNALLLAVAAAGVVVFARRQLCLSARAACAIAIVGSLAIPTLVLSTIVMSEMLFLALLIPALLMAERVVDPERCAPRAALWLGVVAGVLMLVRTHGIVFAAAVCVALIVARRRRQLVVFAASAAVVVAPWQIWQRLNAGALPVALRGEYGSYGAWLANGTAHNPLGELARTVASTSRELFAMFAALASAGLPSVALRGVATTIAIVLFVAGIVFLWRRARVTSLFLAAYLAIVLLWPFTPARFVWGIWPLVIVAIATAAIELWKLAAKTSYQLGARSALAVAMLVVAFGYGTYTLRGYRGQWWSSIPRQTAPVVGPTLAWVGEHARPTDVVASNADQFIYLYTGRTAVPATSFSTADFFATPSAESRSAALRSILETYRIDVVAIVANDSLEAAARRMASAGAPGPSPALVLRDSVPHGLIFTPMVR